MTNKEFLATYGGKLAAAAAALSSALTYVATDPTAAVLLTDFLPGPLRLVVILAIAGAAYVLPMWTAKKDAGSAPGE